MLEVSQVRRRKVRVGAAWLVWGQFWGQDRLEENLKESPGGIQTRLEEWALPRFAVRPPQGH